MLIGALALASAATTLCAMAHSLEMLITLRFVAGIGLGGALPAVSSLTAEHARPENRNGTVTLMYIGYPMGAVVGGAVTRRCFTSDGQTYFWARGRRAFWLWPSRCCCPNRSNARLPTPPPGRG